MGTPKDGMYMRTHDGGEGRWGIGVKLSKLCELEIQRKQPLLPSLAHACSALVSNWCEALKIHLGSKSPKWGRKQPAQSSGRQANTNVEYGHCQEVDSVTLISSHNTNVEYGLSQGFSLLPCHHLKACKTHYEW